MSWTLRFHPATRKDIRRLSQERRDFILNNVLPKISTDPHQNGSPLHGPLKGLWKHQAGGDRIAYAIDQKLKEVIIIEIGPRGGFYKRLHKRLQK